MQLPFETYQQALALAAFVATAAAFYFFVIRKSQASASVLPAPVPAPKGDDKDADVTVQHVTHQDGDSEPHKVATDVIASATEALHAAKDASESPVDHVKEGSKALSDAAKKLLEVVPNAVEAAKWKLAGKPDSSVVVLGKQQFPQRRKDD